MLTLTIQDQPNGVALPDLTQRLTRATFSTNQHGDESLQVSAPLSLAASFQRYDHAGLPHAIITDGAAMPFQGRIEDTAIQGDGLSLTAFGYQRALSDSRYTALWSSSDVAAWRPIIETEVTGATPTRYAFDTNNRIYIAPQKNATLGTTGTNKFGIQGFLSPDQGSTSIVGAQFTFEYALPAANWRVAFQNRTSAFAGIANPWLFAAAGATGVVRGAICVSFAAAKIVNFFMDYNAADAVFVGETGSTYLTITNLRLVTSIANMIDVTNTAGWAAGANITITVTSTARMYAGQRLFFDYGATSESCIVASVTNSTQFIVSSIVTAVGAPGFHIRAHVIYADQIARDLASTVSALNSTQLLPDTTQIASPALDLFDETYQDQIPTAVLDHLIGLGDTQVPPALWEWGVTGARQLYYRAVGAVGQTWYVDVTAIDVQRSLEQLANSVYALYQDASGRALRGAASTDATSVTRAGVTRQQAAEASTTSLTQANVTRDATLEDKADPAPRFGLTFSAVYNSVGGRVPLWLPRAGDTVVIRNLPPTISVSIDQLRTFRIARTTCDLIARTLTIEPFVPLPTVQALLARGLRGQTP